MGILHTIYPLSCDPSLGLSNDPQAHLLVHVVIEWPHMHMYISNKIQSLVFTILLEHNIEPLSQAKDQRCIRVQADGFSNFITYLISPWGQFWKEGFAQVQAGTLKIFFNILTVLYISIPVYTMDRQWCPRERSLGQCPRGRGVTGVWQLFPGESALERTLRAL